MVLKLDVDAEGARADTLLASNVNVELQYFDRGPDALRLVPANPAASALVFRMLERGPRTQMPPIATELVDDEGAGLVTRWVERLPSSAGGR